MLNTLSAADVGVAFGPVRRLVRGRIGLAVCVAAIGVLGQFVLVSGAAAESSACSNKQFRTGLGANLPDCRAYEQASPAVKNGGSVQGFPSLFSASEDGSGITWYNTSATAIPSSGGSTGALSELLSRRVGSEWLTQRLAAPQLPMGPGAYIQGTSYLGVTPDGRIAVASASGANCGGQLCSSLWAIDTQSATATQIAGETGEASEFRYAFDGASVDGSKIFFETRAQLLPDAHQGVPNLYVWDRATGTISVAGILPGEPPAAPESGAFGGSYDWPDNEVYAGGALNGLAVEAQHAVSSSGDQIFFTVPEATGELGQFEYGQLFLRQGLVAGRPSTIRISEPNQGVVSANADIQPAAFQESSPDGAHAFFLSGAKLTADANTGPTESGRDLYRWDRATGELVDIAPDSTDENGAQVIGLLGADEAGTSGFFVAEAALATGATANSRNIYQFEETGPGSFAIHFVALLNDVSVWDSRNWAPRTLSPLGGEYFSEESTGIARNSRVNPTATTLLFTSLNELTDFHNAGDACGSEESAGVRAKNEAGEALCAELYLYSTADRKVICVSCNPDGHIVGADAKLQTSSVGSASTPSQGATAAYTRNLSSNGHRVFFETGEPLVSADGNGGERCSLTDCTDVYEWESPGEGSCQFESAAYSPQNHGCVYLLSPGQSPALTLQASNFLDASADGSQVFISTNNPLVPTDIDEATDAYNVSVDGGLPSQHPVSASECLGEECQGPPALRSAAAEPASSVLSGSGNRKPHTSKKRCRKGTQKKGKPPRHCTANGKKRGHKARKKATPPRRPRLTDSTRRDDGRA